MPGGYENMMYSFDLGPAHFISITTEFYYFLYYGIKPVVLQYEWLVNDLKVNLLCTVFVLLFKSTFLHINSIINTTYTSYYIILMKVVSFVLGSK